MAGIQHGSLINASATAGGGSGYNRVVQVNASTATLVQKIVPMECLNQSFTERVGTIKGIEYSISGMFDSVGDITGQKIIMDNVASGAELWFQYWFEAAQWGKARVEIDTFDIKAAPGGAVEFSLTAKSNGTVTYGTS